jgi:hypothetical protein
MADTRNGGGKGSEKNGAKARRGRRKQQVVTAATAGAAIGIGSAALVAALLYARKPEERQDKSAGTDPRFEPRES